MNVAVCQSGPVEQCEEIVVIDPGLIDVCGPRETGSQPRLSPLNGFVHRLIGNPSEFAGELMLQCPSFRESPSTMAPSPQRGERPQPRGRAAKSDGPIRRALYGAGSLRF